MTADELASGPPLDLVVIGGGINGCAIAAEAAARGLSVALFEKDDFGFGTTWRSTKLIHGGLRYLEHGDVGLVFESLRERTWLLRTRSHLVRPQRFILPVLPWTRRPAWQLRTGLALYDMLSLYRGVPSHRVLRDERMHEIMPALPASTHGGFSFYDARVLAPERLALELASEAAKRGATISNHATVSRILVEGDTVTGVKVTAGTRTITVAASSVVNAAGPWVDVVNDLGDCTMPNLLGVTKGIHIAVEVEHLPRDAVFSTARSDGRVFFAVPQGQLLLVGTTDDRYEGDPGTVRPTRNEIDYLLEEARSVLPGLDVASAQVRYAYAGLRPLQSVKGGPEEAITRRHAVIDHGARGGPKGMYSVVGGKLSTFRPLARDVMKAIGAHANPGAQHVDERPDWRDSVRKSGLDRAAWPHLRVYGEAIADVVAGGRDEICPHSHAVSGEVLHAIRSEWATRLSDIILRRTGIGWASCRGLCCHRAIADIAASEIGWSRTERMRQIDEFEADVAYHLPRPEDLVGNTNQ